MRVRRIDSLLAQDAEILNEKGILKVRRDYG